MILEKDYLYAQSKLQNHGHLSIIKHDQTNRLEHYLNFLDIGIMFNLPHYCRHRTTRTPKRIKAVRERVSKNPKRSMRKMAAGFKNSKTQIRRIVQNDLKLKILGQRKCDRLARLI